MYRNFFKRPFDVVMATLAFPFWLLILLVVAPLIYLEDRGSIFYIAPRLGKDGKLFQMYKFRSMKMHAPDIRNEDGSTFNSEDDPRLTKVGRFIRKTSLDETPQLLNVLRGEMSLVGPRPDLPDSMAHYVEGEIRKLEVQPGVTGYSQAYYRNTIPWKERIQNDLYYIDHLSFVLDLRILFRTVVTVLKRDQIFISPGTDKLEG